MGDGEHPINTHWNSSYSGSMLFDFPNDMAEPVGVRYDDLINKAKQQHPLVAGILTGMEWTIVPTKFRMVGTTSGIISAQRVVTGPVGHTIDVAANKQVFYSCHQVVEVGALTARPEIVIDFPQDISTTRHVYGPDYGYAGSQDTFVRYQSVEKSVGAFTADFGWGTIGFIIKSNVWVNPRGTVLTMVSGQTEDQAALMNKKRHSEIDKIAKIDKIKRLTLPVSDAKN